MKKSASLRRPRRPEAFPTRPTVAEISIPALKHNLEGIRRKVGARVKIMAVVKAEAYGHGLVGVARALEPKHADYFGVAIAEEGKALRVAGIRKPIHVFALPSPAQAALTVQFKLEPTVCTLEEAGWIDRAAQRARKTVPVHVKIETGMNRIGVKPENLGTFLGGLARLRRLRVRGVFTHFANSDEADKSFARTQLARFESAIETFQSMRVEYELEHCANSAAILDLPESYHDMVRPGIMMYGYYPSHTTTESIPLKPVLRLKTEVSLVKEIAAGESVSYGRIFVARDRTSIATLPLGYADGYFRLLTGKASVLIHGKRFPVVGRICMDQIMVDVGREDVRAGDEAVLIGPQEGVHIGAWDLADALGTIPYEITCAIAQRVPRIYGAT